MSGDGEIEFLSKEEKRKVAIYMALEDVSKVKIKINSAPDHDPLKVMHDDVQYTIDKAIALETGLKKRGYKIVKDE